MTCPGCGAVLDLGTLSRMGRSGQVLGSIRCGRCGRRIDAAEAARTARPSGHRPSRRLEYFVIRRVSCRWYGIGAVIALLLASAATLAVLISGRRGIVTAGVLLGVAGLVPWIFQRGRRRIARTFEHARLGSSAADLVSVAMRLPYPPPRPTGSRGRTHRRSPWTCSRSRRSSPSLARHRRATSGQRMDHCAKVPDW
jgi:hypothetical protein